MKKNSGNSTNAAKEVKKIQSHFGGDHNLCPKCKDSRCEYQEALSVDSTQPHISLDSRMDTFIGDFLRKHGYSNEEFIGKVGVSTNPNESIHHILFDMTSKSEAMGVDVMQIGAALVVIRNNDGFAGLIDILTNLCGFVPESTQELCRKHDFATVAASGKKKPSKKPKEKI